MSQEMWGALVIVGVAFGYLLGWISKGYRGQKKMAVQSKPLG